MLKDTQKMPEIDSKELKALRETQNARLAMLQQQVRQAKIPVVVMFEGWNAAGKGVMISELIRSLDPRGFKVFTLDCDDSAEERFPYMHRYWKTVPLYGNIAVLDGGWYRGVADPQTKPRGGALKRRFTQILDFEKQLADDGYVLLKFFLHIGKKGQKHRFDDLEERADTRWRVTRDDLKQNRDYDEWLESYDEMLKITDKPGARWHVIHSGDRKQAASQVYAEVISALESALAAKQQPAQAASPAPLSPGEFETLPTPRLNEIDLNCSVDEKQYRTELKELQKRLSELHGELYQRRVPLVLGFEGWDAAGKGGAIKRLTRALDPRGFEVVPTAAPTPDELHHQYLWRFWRDMPKDGHIAIFDRTWYGRVMVERIEGFATDEQWRGAYAEINQFERSLTDWGAIVIKFWLQIDSDEQLARFTDRQNTPEKQWKITDEDWRNRDKWPQYETAVNEMLWLTNTKHAPWVIVESNDKRYARLKVLRTVIEAIENRL